MEAGRKMVRSSSATLRERRRQRDEVSGIYFEGLVNTVQVKALRYRSNMGNTYLIDCSDNHLSQFAMTHGQRVLQKKGVDKGSVGTVLGVYLGSLWIQFDGDKCATCCKNCFTREDLYEAYGFVEPEEAAVQADKFFVVPGPFGAKYYFDVVAVKEKYGLTSGERLVSRKYGNRECTVLGEFLGQPWVQWKDDAKPSPLGKYTKDDVQSEYVFEPFVAVSSSPVKVTTESVSPPRAVEGEVPSKVSVAPITLAAPPPAPVEVPKSPNTDAGPAFPLSPPAVVMTLVHVDKVNNQAVYRTTAGREYVFNISSESCQPFGYYYGEKLLHTKGGRRGQQSTVVGVHLGTLWIHTDGEKGASSCLYCFSKEELDERYGFERVQNDAQVASPPAPVSSSVSQELIPPKEVSRAISFSPEKSPTAIPPLSIPTEFTTSPPMLKKDSFQHRGLFGDVMTFDSTDAACKPFGFKHGDVVRARKGLDAGKVFTIVGVSMGCLWVLPDDKPKCTVLSHCHNGEDIKRLWDFEHIGTKQVSEETTTFTSPRATPRKSSSPPSAVENVTSSRSVKGISSEASSPPKFIAGATLMEEASAPREAFEAASSIPAYDVSEEQWEEGRMPQTRYFLRAYATYKLQEASPGTNSKLSFHTFYMNDTCNRLLRALEDLTKFRTWWYDQRKSQNTTLPPFLSASWEEMLNAMKLAPASVITKI
eukprot:PhF_6_TR37922/c0_g1_i1/m.56668